MTDITELFSFLMPDKAAEEAIAANDPWTPLQAAPDLMSQMLLKESQDPSRSKTDLILGGLLSGLGSGFLGRLSSNYQTEKLADYTSLLPGMADGTVTGKPENMSQDVFNIAQKKANQYDIFQKLQSEEENRQLEALKNSNIAKDDSDFLAKLKEKAILGTTKRERDRALNAYLQLSGQGATGSVDSSIAAGGGSEDGSLVSVIGEEAAGSYNKILDEYGPREASVFLNNTLKAQNKKKLRADGAPPMGIEATDKFTKANALTPELLAMADKLDSGKQGWLGYQAMQMFSGLDKEGTAVEMKNLVDYLTRARTGAALNENEEKTYDKMIAGDATASPRTAAIVLRKLAASNARLLLGELNTREALAKDYAGLKAGLEDVNNKYGTGKNGGIETRILKDGSTVRVQKQPDGSYVEVQ